MADPDARKRILDMLAAGRISVDAATDLLRAVSVPAGPKPTPELPAAPRPRGAARILRISVDAPSASSGSGAKVRVNIPLALAKYAMRFIPRETTEELSDQGIDIAQLLQDLGDDVPDGRLVDIEAEEGDGDGKMAIVIEVV